MNKMNYAVFFTILSFCILPVLAQDNKKQNKKTSNNRITNLHDFMEDYTKPAMQYFKKTGDRVYLNKILVEVPSLGLDDQREDWKKIVDKSLDSGKAETSCKSCHDLYKKDYKKKFRKREIQIPESLIGLDKEIRAARK
ncbi:hypothetical protein [Leptospira sp. GIMC2001]|uniref:hypothetical protein n=1 Tax=Leptospira sp. GIMC2001 TaxID=1513297 RepID=UPI00234BBD32|nr:hypothetical protein [Leptospira sp. GIMC2001]WCL48808.1 hypothetical protein O4O04_16095 [Leptospira sp. GIMC2001]